MTGARPRDTRDRLGGMGQLGARAIGGSAAAVWLLSLAASLTFDGPAGFSRRGLVLAGLVLAAVLGVVVAFHYEDWGGKATVGAGAGLVLYLLAASGDDPLLAATFAGGPFMAAGGLFIWSAHRRRRHVR